MQINKITSASLLIAGTCIGAGMLALPVSTAPVGFFLSVFVLFLCWGVMYFTGLLTLEANLQVPEGSNFISMARLTLGKSGEVVTWLSYVLLLYSLMAAYLSGGGALLTDVLHTQVSAGISDWSGPVSWAVITGAVVYLGAGHVDGLNRLLIIGLVCAYAVLVFLSVPHLKPIPIELGHPKYLLSALTVIIVSFGYHVTIPGLRAYLRSDEKKMSKAILIGSLIPLGVYLVWMGVVFSVIPLEGSRGLLAILKSGEAATGIVKALSVFTQNNWVQMGAEIFVFFAIASSFLGIAFSLFDFVADGLKLPQNMFGRLITLLLTFVPPLFYASYYPKGFIMALSYGGVFVAILHGILPAMMVYRGRKLKALTTYRAPGGNLSLYGILLVSALVITAQVSVSLHVL